MSRAGKFKTYSVVTKDGLKISRVLLNKKMVKERIEAGDKLKEAD